MRVLAFDCSLTATGYATPDGRLDTLVPPKGARDGRRLAWLDDSFKALIQTHNPTHIIAEAPFTHSPNPTGAINLHKLYGCLEAQAWRAGIDVWYIPPSSLKKAATGYGRAGKQDMITAATDCDFTPANDNEADAALLWFGAMHDWFTTSEAAS